MVYLYKWATTVSEGDKKIIFIIHKGHHSYECNLNIFKKEAHKQLGILNSISNSPSPQM